MGGRKKLKHSTLFFLLHHNIYLNDDIIFILYLPSSNVIYDNNRPSRKIIIISSVSGAGICALVVTIIQSRRHREKLANEKKTDLEVELDKMKKYVGYVLDTL
jgi:hypothetical protein